MMKSFLLHLFILLVGSTTSLFAQCPNCLVALPTSLPADTLFLSPMADGEVGLPYLQDLSFRMPLSTDPVNAIDPGVPGGLSINEITLLSIANVPPGLNWEASESVYIPEENTDGCLRFCGTPLVPGLYQMEVTVAAKVSILTQTTSFTLDLLILPASSATEGFSMSNNIACGEAVVEFENNIPSNGATGFSYLWDFGNGNSTLNEQPNVQVYDSPGVYEVRYQAIVDTAGYLLTEIEVLATGCTDFPTFPNFSTAPDLNITVYDPDSNIVFQTPNFDNTFPPISASLALPLGEGNYTIEVIDDDSGINLGDDLCGLVSFNKFVSGIIISDEFEMRLTIFHPVDTIESVDTIYVYPLPEAPIIEASGPTLFCDGDTLFLETSYSENVQWYLEETLLIGEQDAVLTVTEPGRYWVEYFDVNGCQSVSEILEVATIPLPAAPAFTNDNNLLTLFD
ncbi:MAG: PKD domain-containing protein, partial [Bacteroidota bacterium]